MFLSFTEYIDRKRLFSKHDKILLAVSGGIDSMVMTDLFVKSGIEAAIAHCNFDLRGQESDNDEQFVKEQAAKYCLPFFSVSFQTEEYSQVNGISIQMAARELRYEWLEKIRQNNGYDYIAIAHNSDDSVETFLLNIIRGTGIRGLTGIAPINGKIVRPLLFASRNDIELYCVSEGIDFREDSSNSSLKYKRNKIRHQIIPLLKEISPEFTGVALSNIDRFNDIKIIYETAINEKFELVNMAKAGCLPILSINALSILNPIDSYLYEFIKPYGFSGFQAKEIAQSLNAPSGKLFFSASHRIVKDRDSLIITILRENPKEEIVIEQGTREFVSDFRLRLDYKNFTKKFIIITDPNVACLDADELNFPLKLRRWVEGDIFKPFGMTGMKKLSNFFSDNKFSLPEKENTWLLESSGRIAWVVGHRIDDRFKIKQSTKKIVIISYHQ